MSHQASLPSSQQLSPLLSRPVFPQNYRPGNRPLNLQQSQVRNLVRNQVFSQPLDRQISQHPDQQANRIPSQRACPALSQLYSQVYSRYCSRQCSRVRGLPDSPPRYQLHSQASNLADFHPINLVANPQPSPQPSLPLTPRCSRRLHQRCFIPLWLAPFSQVTA